VFSQQGGKRTQRMTSPLVSSGQSGSYSASLSARIDRPLTDHHGSVLGSNTFSNSPHAYVARSILDKKAGGDLPGAHAGRSPAFPDLLAGLWSGTLFPAYVAYPQAFDIAARNPTLRWKYALHSRQFIEESVIFTRTRAMMPASPLTVTRSAARRSFVKADEAQWR